MLLGILVLLCAGGALASECIPPACYPSTPTSVCSNVIQTLPVPAGVNVSDLASSALIGSKPWNVSFSITPVGFKCPSSHYLLVNIAAATPYGTGFSMRIADGNGAALFDGIGSNSHNASGYATCYNFTSAFTVTNEIDVTLACIANADSWVFFQGVWSFSCYVLWTASYSCAPIWTPITGSCNPLSCFQPTTYTCLDSNTSAAAVALCASMYGPTPSYTGRPCLDDPSVGGWCGTHQTATVTTYGNNGCSGAPTSSQTMNTNQCYDGVGSSSRVQRGGAEWRYQVFSAPGCSGSPQFILSSNDTKADGCATTGSLAFSVKVSTVSSEAYRAFVVSWVGILTLLALTAHFSESA